MSVRYSQEEKQHHLNAWEKSGLSKTAYCKENGLTKSRFYAWLSTKKESTDKRGSNAFISVNINKNEVTKVTEEAETVKVMLADGLSVTCQVEQLVSVIQALRLC